MLVLGRQLSSVHLLLCVFNGLRHADSAVHPVSLSAGLWVLDAGTSRSTVSNDPGWASRASLDRSLPSSIIHSAHTATCWIPLLSPPPLQSAPAPPPPHTHIQKSSRWHVHINDSSEANVMFGDAFLPTFPLLVTPPPLSAHVPLHLKHVGKRPYHSVVL